MKTVSVAQAASAQEAVLPARVQEVLGELVGAAKEGLLALSVGVGLGVLAELMNEEVDGSSGRRAATTPTAARCVMATRTGRSRSVADACRSSARGPALPMAPARCRCRRMRTSLTATR
jgi:hypothetical protein